MKLYTVKAANMTATYNAGKYVAESPEEATQKARAAYADSATGRSLRDVGAFRFFISDEQRIDG